jgi:hypothetical protein
MEDEVADAAMLCTASDRRASAKDSVDAALAMLRQWAKDAEAKIMARETIVELKSVMARYALASFRLARNRCTRSRVRARTWSGIG